MYWAWEPEIAAPARARPPAGAHRGWGYLHLTEPVPLAGERPQDEDRLGFRLGGLILRVFPGEPVVVRARTHRPIARPEPTCVRYVGHSEPPAPSPGSCEEPSSPARSRTGGPQRRCESPSAPHPPDRTS